MYFPYAHKPPTKKSSSCATLVPSTMKDHSRRCGPAYRSRSDGKD